MRISAMIIGVLVFIMPCISYADSDSELRAEILGESAGKAIAGDHSEYQPDKAKEECESSFQKQWKEHFEEKGFSTDEAVVNSFVGGCMKKYNKAFGK